MKYKLSELREEYIFEGLNESDIEKDPFKLFDIWFREALDKKVFEPNAMTLATADKSGRPSARIVLLKDFSKDGFVFYTNYKSRKGKELEANPYAALLFWWNILGRQVRIEGKMEMVSSSESDNYFASRPRGSQLGAFISDQSSAVPDFSYLYEKYEKAKAEFKNEIIPRPQNWGGYRLKPQSFEFWQGRENRLHDRLLFKKSHEPGWSIERLSP